VTQMVDDVLWKDRVDLDALMVALVLVPHSYPRNRFYHLFRDPAAFRVRRRAAWLRSVIGDLAGDAEELVIERADDGITLSYRLIEMGVRRTTLLDANELALVKLAVERAAPRDDLPSDPDASAHLTTLLERLYQPE
jgi:hypothetical protein